MHDFFDGVLAKHTRQEMAFVSQDVKRRIKDTWTTGKVTSYGQCLTKQAEHII